MRVPKKGNKLCKENILIIVKSNRIQKESGLHLTLKEALEKSKDHCLIFLLKKDLVQKILKGQALFS
jgi:hypothetical protein